MDYIIKIQKYLLYVVTLAISNGCSFAHSTDKQASIPAHISESLSGCTKLNGDFSFQGVSEGIIVGQVSFLRAMARPGSALGIAWFRILIDVPNEKIHVLYFDQFSEKILESYIPGQCVNGRILEVRRHPGSSGGALGPDVTEYSYSRTLNGDLVVSVKSRGITYHLPGMPSNYASEGSSHFAAKIKEK